MPCPRRQADALESGLEATRELQSLMQTQALLRVRPARHRGVLAVGLLLALLLGGVLARLTWSGPLLRLDPNQSPSVDSQGHGGGTVHRRRDRQHRRRVAQRSPVPSARSQPREQVLFTPRCSSWRCSIWTDSSSIAPMRRSVNWPMWSRRSGSSARLDWLAKRSSTICATRPRRCRPNWPMSGTTASRSMPSFAAGWKGSSRNEASSWTRAARVPTPPRD